MGSRDFVGRLPDGFCLRKLHLARRLSSLNGLPDAAITVVSWIGFEMHRVSQPVPPIEPILFHNCDDSSALWCEAFGAARTGSNAADIDGESGFMDGSARGKGPIEAGVRSTATGAERAPMELRLAF
jgi:hypothetical protein